jgi:hypothetical protein
MAIDHERPVEIDASDRADAAADAIFECNAMRDFKDAPRSARIGR